MAGTQKSNSMSSFKSSSNSQDEVIAWNLLSTYYMYTFLPLISRMAPRMLILVSSVQYAFIGSAIQL